MMGKKIGKLCMCLVIGVMTIDGCGYKQENTLSTNSRMEESYESEVRETSDIEIVSESELDIEQTLEYRTEEPTDCVTYEQKTESSSCEESAPVLETETQKVSKVTIEVKEEVSNEEMIGNEEMPGDEEAIGSEEGIEKKEVIELESITEDIIEETVPHVACNWDEGSIVSQSNCLAEGTMIYICSVCGNSRQEAISRTEHNFVTEITEATCLENGKHKKYCAFCGTIVSEMVLPAKGHNMTESWWWQATCTETGYRNVLCSVCGYIDEANSGTVERLPHSIIDVKVQQGNCMMDTVIYHKCSVCGEMIEEERYTEHDDHNWCTDEEGTYCERCGISR